MASSSDNKPNSGLASCLSNVFKLAEVDGLKWIRYVGPNSSSLEAPRSDPVLTSYAKLLNDGYACSWRRLSPSTDGVSGESKDLWVFYFTTLPDLSGQLASELKEERSGSWEDGMSTEASAMLFRALNSLIERSLLSENFLPLGKWYARPDPSMGSEGRGCFLCNFSFFIHAHRYICASVDVRAGPALQLLQASHLHQALSSSSGMQVILSPSGLNGIMTGHSYRITDPGIDDLMEEWKLFYPRRFENNMSSQLPAAVEVVLGGVRLRYPSRFVFVYHTEDTIPTPPPSPLNEGMMGKVIQGGWEDTMSVDPLLQQKQCEECSCAQKLSSRDSSHSGSTSKPSRPHRLLSGSSESLSERSPRQHRFRPYNTSTSHPTDNATPMKEHPTPSSLTLNTSVLNSKRKKMGPPKYTTPLPSPAVTIPSSPAIKQSFSQGHVSFPPSIQPSSVPPTPQAQGASPRPGSAKSKALYDKSRIANLKKGSREDEKGFCNYLSFEDGWWQCMDLPESVLSMQKMLQPMAHMRIGVSPGGGHPLLPPLPGLSPVMPPFPGPGDRRMSSDQRSTPTTPSKKRPNSGKGMRGGRTKMTKRGSDVSTPTMSLLDPRGIPFPDESSIGDMEAETPHNVTVLENIVEPLADAGQDGGEKGPIKTGDMDLTSESAVKIQHSLGDLFDDSDEEEMHTDNNVPSETDLKGGNIAMTKLVKPLGPDSYPFHPSDFSHIYPTPPSVESTDEKFDDGKLAGATILGGTGGMAYMEEKSEVVEQYLLNKLSPLDDVAFEVIPSDFRPLSNLSSTNQPQSLQKYVHNPKTSSSSSSSKNLHKDKNTSSLASSSQSLKSEPQKFIFPPVIDFNTRPSLTLPLTGADHTISPIIPTPYSSSPLRAPGRMLKPLTLSAPTPVDSPFDPITPTPLSSSRLVPVLPEAHALYINLALLDSALGANVSDVTVNLSVIQSIIKTRTTYRQRLDSVGSMPGGSTLGSTSSAMLGGGGFEEEGLIGEEKPLMMLGIADYPSLGFKEDLVVNTPTPESNTLFSVLGLEKAGISFTDERYHKISTKFLSLVQDYCLHLCLTGKQELGSAPSSASGSSISTTPVSGSLQPYQQQYIDKQHSKEICRLYHTQSVSSAILCGKQLVSSGKPFSSNKIPPPPSSAGLSHQSSVTLDKEDNSASWILDLLSLPTKFVTKKLKELKTVFQSSFHHAPCIRVSTKGPLSLRDLQNLTPSHTPAGDDCQPLPMQPLMVGCDHEWLTVSPLALTAWDKLMLEPYSSQKHILYMVLSPGGETFSDTLKTFFCNLSVTYKNCKLGAHIPLDKGSWEHGIVTNANKVPLVPGEEPEDKKPKIDQLELGATPSLERLCKDVISSYLSKLPTENEDLLQCSTFANETNPPKSVPVQCDTPICIVVYVVMRGNGKKKLHQGTRAGGVRAQPAADMDEAVSEEVVEVMKVFSNILAEEDIPEETRNRLVIQPLDESELVGPHSNTTQHVRSLAFSVFSRCRPILSLKPRSQHMTGFGPIINRPIPSCPIRLFYPLYILSPDPPLLPNPLLASSQTQPPSAILFGPDECTLNCAYCVSADQKFLLAIVCDRQAELLDSCVIGLQQNDTDGASCRQALQKLWAYLLSVMATSIIKWNLVITRLGKPSSIEVKEWPLIVFNDGLMTANQLLSQECQSCSLSNQQPSIKNVIMVSVQPERNIQLFPQIDPDSSVSHMLILPPHPSVLSEMTPTDGGMSFDDFMNVEPEMEGADPLIAVIGDDLFAPLDDWGAAADNQPTSFTPGAENASVPLATGYLISTTPPGHLPSEFWGHEKPQSVCNMFKTLLHCHLSVNPYPGSPPDVLCSVLLSFDALSWLSINHITQKRNSSLPIHLFLLSKLYNFFSLLSRPSR